MNSVKMVSHRVEIYTGKKKSWERDTYTVQEVDVLAENDNYVVLNDCTFTKLEKKKDKYFNCHSVLNIPTVDVHVDNNIWSDGVIFNLYSHSEWPTSRIEAEIKTAIQKKCGWMKSKVSFAILKSKNEASESLNA